MKIAIQGAEGSFHAIAARTMFGDSAQLVFCNSFFDVFHVVSKNQVDRGVVAIENSLYGSINETYDLLVKHKLWICNETYQHVGLHLLGLHNGDVGVITDVYSQAPALGESEDFLHNNLPHASRHEYEDTARAAEMVARQQDVSKAAIAGEAAAKQYGLKILARNIETHHHNYTRFIALSHQETEQHTTQNKTSIIFQTNDTPGSLHAVLGVFADRGINLTKLESRPIVGKAWRYMYYIDFESGCNEDLLAALKPLAQNIRILGIYPNNTQLPN